MITTAERVGDNWIVEQGPEAGRSRDRRGPAEGAAGHDRRSQALSRPPSGAAGLGKLIRHGAIFHRPPGIRDRHRDRHYHSWASLRFPNLPIAAFPEVVPPVVQITANLLGRQRDRSRKDRRATDRGATGRPRRHAVLSLRRSANNGSITISVTFQLGTNPDTATVQTQNKVNIALPRLPPGSAAPGRCGEEGVQRVSDGDRPHLAGRAATIRCSSPTTRRSIC